MSNQIRTPEELLNEIWDVVKSFNILWMTNYMQCDPSLYNMWKRRKTLPYRNIKKIVEYLEMHNDDIVTLCWHLMDYYNAEVKRKLEIEEEKRERNRKRNRERYAQNKNQ